MKKRYSCYLLILIFIISLTACGQNPDSAGVPPKQVQESEQGNARILSVYFQSEYAEEEIEQITYTGEWIQEIVGGELLKMEDGLEDIPEFEGYETILLGFSSEGEELPEPVIAFLEKYDFGAKTIIPVVVGKTADLEQVTEKISLLQPGALLQNNGLKVSENDIKTQESDIKEWAEGLGLNEQGELPDSRDTVASAVIKAKEQQVFYLWEEDNMPSYTEYTVNNGNYSDDPDFRPYLVFHPVPEGTEVKGAVLINAGGAFQFRSDSVEGTPVAEALSERGYQSFVVNYRLRPYTQEEGALDLTRAVRFVRSHAEDYGINEKDIAVMGFSAGGILSGEELLNFDSFVSPVLLDEDYVPDTLDEISADAAACGMIYSFYGRLSVASTDVEAFREADLPPTYFAYGSRDPFVDQFEACIEALTEAGVSVESHEMQGMPHGFGTGGDWLDGYDQWLDGIFSE